METGHPGGHSIISTLFQRDAVMLTEVKDIGTQICIQLVLGLTENKWI